MRFPAAVLLRSPTQTIEPNARASERSLASTRKVIFRVRANNGTDVYHVSVFNHTDLLSTNGRNISHIPCIYTTGNELAVQI